MRYGAKNNDEYFPSLKSIGEDPDLDISSTTPLSTWHVLGGHIDINEIRKNLIENNMRVYQDNSGFLVESPRVDN